MRLHHVQVACPRGGEALARRFYAEGLGLTEVAKPPALAGRGGCWFRAYAADGAVTAELHVGVEEPFAPARKAHPALVLAGVGELHAIAHRVDVAGVEVEWSERDSFPPYVRCHVRDPHGNRVELLAEEPGAGDQRDSRAVWQPDTRGGIPEV